MRRNLIFVAALLAVAVMASHAMALSVGYDAGTTYYTTAITDAQTFGDEMAGMTVTAFFSDQSSEAAIWAATGSGAGGAFGSNWSLVESGDTFGAAWTLSVIAGATQDIVAVGPSLRRLVIDAGTGGTVFDISWNPPSTENSHSGWTVQSDAIGQATYRDLIALNGQAPVGDLYRHLDIEFETGVLPGGSIMFIADTDTLSIRSDLVPTPEPGTMALLGLGLLGVGGVVVRRRRK